jgi:hypothetical protein
VRRVRPATRSAAAGAYAPDSTISIQRAHPACIAWYLGAGQVHALLRGTARASAPQDRVRAPVLSRHAHTRVVGGVDAMCRPFLDEMVRIGLAREVGPRAARDPHGCCALLAERAEVGHAERMAAHTNDVSPIPSAPVSDLDIDRDGDEEEWERRVMQLAAVRIQAARARLERLGIIDADAKLVSSELPPDMTPESDTTLETG